MILKPRINLKEIPYSYIEAEIDSSVEPDMGAALTEFANYAVALEDAAKEFGFKPEHHPMAQEAIARGATPAPQTQATPRSSTQGGANSGPTCEQCGGPTEYGPWRNTAKGEMRFPNCTSGCMTPDGKYALGGRPQYKQGR